MSKLLQRDPARNRPSVRAIKRRFSRKSMNTAYEIGLVFFSICVISVFIVCLLSCLWRNSVGHNLFQ